MDEEMKRRQAVISVMGTTRDSMVIIPYKVCN